MHILQEDYIEPNKCMKQAYHLEDDRFQLYILKIKMMKQDSSFISEPPICIITVMGRIPWMVNKIIVTGYIKHLAPYLAFV